MAAISTRATKRTAIAIALVVALPFAVGIVSGFSYFVTGERVTPSWVHSTRVLLSWLTAIAVFAWFVAGNDERLVSRMAIIVVASWLGSECLSAGAGAIISRVADPNYPIWTFQLRYVGVTVLRALAGMAAGLVIRNAIMRPVVGAGS